MLRDGIIRVFKFFFNSRKIGNLRLCCHNTNPKISTLFVPGRYGNYMYQIVKPSIEVKYIVENLEEIKRNCKRRTINLEIDNLLQNITDWVELKKNVLSTSSAISELMKEKSEIKNVDEFEEKVCKYRKNLQNFKEELHDLEDFIMPIFRKIPNKLHPNSILEKKEIAYHNAEKSFAFKTTSHVTIGNRLNEIEFSNASPSAYYLTGSMANIEQAIMNYYFTQLECLDFVALSASDFCKSFILEACGKDPYSADSCISIFEDDRKNGQKLNLVGTSSLEALCAYFVNINMGNEKLPIKYFTYGRSYEAWNRHNTGNNLFSVVQSNSFHSVIVSKTDDAEACFEDMLTTLVSILSKFDIAFRSYNVLAKDLNEIESQRVQIELWSAHQKEYVNFGYVSQCNDFLSKRLRMTYGKGNVAEGHLNVVHAKIAILPTLLGCLIENNQTDNGTFSMPQEFKQHMLKL